MSSPATETPTLELSSEVVYAGSPTRRPWPVAVAVLLVIFLVGLPVALLVGSFLTPAPPPPAIPPALQANVSASTSQGPHPLIVAFHSEVSGGTPPYTYRWTFGDSSGCCASAAADPTHLYNVTGTYEARLVVTDQALREANASLVVRVDPAILSTTVLAAANSTLAPGTSNFSASPFQVPTSTPQGSRFSNDSLSGPLQALGCQGPVPCDLFFAAVMTSDQLSSFTSTGVPSAVWCNQGGAGSGCVASPEVLVNLDLTNYQGMDLYLVLWDHNSPGGTLYLSEDLSIYGGW